MKNQKKSLIAKIVIMGVLLLNVFLPLFAATDSSKLPYLHIEDARSSDVNLFNEKGTLVELTSPPQALERGWIVLTGFDPVVIKNRNVTIFLQQESVLSVVSDKADNLQFYLVAGSASFLRDSTYISKMRVNTPIGLYEVMGPGEIFVSSDVSELIFSLGSSVQVTNTITRKRTTLSPYHYLDLADPFLKEKQISKQTYYTLSIRQDANMSSLLPSSSVTDGIKITTIAQVQKEPVVKTPTPPVVKEAKVEPVAPIVKTEPKAPIVKTEPKAPVVKAEPKAPIVKAEPVAPIVKAEPKAPIVKAEPKAPVVKTEPTAPVVSLEPTAPVVEKEKTLDEIYNVYIIHTNDGYGNITNSKIDYSTFATLLDWNKSVHPRTLLVDAGNSLSGSEIANMNKGFDVATLYQILGYDAISPSTAEFAFGIDHLIEAAKIARQNDYLDILASNINDSSGTLLFTPYNIYDLDGYRVGVIGLSFPQDNVEDLSLYPEDYMRLGQQLIDEVKRQADYVVVLGNITPTSPFNAKEIASAVDGIDLFIDGKYGLGKQNVNSTLIVQAGENLTSVGVVELTIKNDTLDSVTAFEITAEDVASPEDHELAKRFNITSIPQDKEVSLFISSLQTELAKQKEVVSPVEELDVQVASAIDVAPVVEEEPAASDVEVASVEEEPAASDVEVASTKEEPADSDVEVASVEEEVSPLAIQPQKGIKTSAALPVSKNVFGVKTSFIATKDDVLGGSATKVGFSINPYFQIKKARVGLQAFYLTDGSIFDPLNAPVNNLDIESGLFGAVRSTMRFIDYFYYGEQSDNLFIQIDDKTPITFGKGFFVNNYTPTKGPGGKESLALYSTATIGKFGIQAFFDDMYLTSFSTSIPQHGSIRFSFDLGDRFELALGSLINTNRTLSDITLYPTLDGSWLITNKRTFQMSLYGGVSTSLDAIPFDINSLYNSSGSGFSAKFPNFQVTGGLEFATKKWDFSLIGSVFNATDPLMQYGSINDTYYSGSRISQHSGVQLLAGISSSYTSDRFGFDMSYLLPIEQDFSRIVPLDAYPSVTGDTLKLGLTYKGENLQVEAGLRKFGAISSIKKLFSFDNGLTGLLDDAYAFIGKAGTSDPYIMGSYTSGPFSLLADLSFNNTGISTLTLSSTIDLSTQKKEIVERKEKLEEGFNYSVDVQSDYTRLFVSGSDENYISLTPVFTLAKNNFSFGIGPKITFNADTADLYTHSFNSPFSFTRGVSGLFASSFDIATDLFNLVDHFEMGSKESSNFLSINRTQTYSSGSLIKFIDTTSNSELQNKLSLTLNLESNLFNMSAFVNDLTSFQLSQARFGVTPFKNYRAEFGVSGIVSAKLGASEKQLDVVTTVDGLLPLISKERQSIALYGSFSTLLGYDRADGFKQMLYNSSSPTFLSRFNNYIISAGINSTWNNFTLDLLASTQEGAISMGMYNSFYQSTRRDILNAFDSQWSNSATTSGRTYKASVDTSYRGEHVDLHASYTLPLRSDFAIIESEDLLHVGLSFDIKNFALGVEYSRKGLIKGTKDFINSTASLMSRAKTFAVNEDSMIGLTLGVTSGNVDLHAKVGTYTPFTNDTTYNGVNAGVTVPMISIGAHINLF